MRLLILSLVGLVAAVGPARAQSGDVTELPVGQIYKDFQFPRYENGQLKFTLAAAQARGITLNRAEATDLKIDLYDSGKVTTTITSPKADIYVADRKMRTSNTVQIMRPNMEASAKICDFDLNTKQFLLRTSVKVVLKNFDASLNLPGIKSGSVSTLPPNAAVVIPPAPPAPVKNDNSLLDTPGAYSSTNSPPLPQ